MALPFEPLLPPDPLRPPVPPLIAPLVRTVRSAPTMPAPPLPPNPPDAPPPPRDGYWHPHHRCPRCLRSAHRPQRCSQHRSHCRCSPRRHLHHSRLRLSAPRRQTRREPRRQWTYHRLRPARLRSNPSCLPSAGSASAATYGIRARRRIRTWTTGIARKPAASRAARNDPIRCARTAICRGRCRGQNNDSGASQRQARQGHPRKSAAPRIAPHHP